MIIKIVCAYNSSSTVLYTFYRSAGEGKEGEWHSPAEYITTAARDEQTQHRHHGEERRAAETGTE